MKVLFIAFIFSSDFFPSNNALRFGINIYSLYHINTIEFRCFQASLDRREITDSFLFVKKFMDAALNDGPDVSTILSSYDFKFAKFNYDHELYQSWIKTKYPYTRGQKNRKFYNVE